MNQSRYLIIENITVHLRLNRFNTFSLRKLVPQINLKHTYHKKPINLSKFVHTESATSFPGSESKRQQLENSKVEIDINKNELITKVLSPQTRHASNMKRKILVEFSSPNICKPFHVGHLRSTIIGNFVSNLYCYLNNDVIKINYLGDWGTQFGFLKVGLELNKVTEAEIKSNPIQILYLAYVSANKLAEHDPNIGDRARLAFHLLENSDTEELQKWEKFRKYTTDELKTIYERLGVKFDEYHWESMYGRKEISQVIDQMQAQGLIFEQEDGKQVVKIGDRRVPIMKSDGTTLYLTRDVAAMLDRYVKYQFDQILYVVDNGQNDHFTALFDIVRQLKMPWCDRTKHIKFGRIKGMSTRKGKVVFLRDILDEAKEIMKMKQIQSPTTKVDITKLDDKTSDILGTTAVIINDLKQRRQRDYEFDWDKALQVKGDSGIKLQYTHCRLISLEKNAGIIAAIVCQPELLQEPEALRLISEMAKFSSVLEKSEETLEACVLVNYLFVLCNSISRALKVLKVKNEESKDVQSQRLLLFNSSRLILKDGMEILGLKPLNEM